MTVTPTTVPLLFTLLSDQSLAIRLAASVALLRILSKGLKEPGDKLQLIKVLSLGQVLEALEEKTRTEQVIRGEAVDEGEESYREALGRLLNVLGLELMKLVDVRSLVSWIIIWFNFQYIGMSTRRHPVGSVTLAEPNSPCHAPFHGRRLRRYVFNNISYGSNYPCQCERSIVSPRDNRRPTIFASINEVEKRRRILWSQKNARFLHLFSVSSSQR